MKNKDTRNRINWKTRFKVELNTYLPIISLNVNKIIPIKTLGGRMD